MSNITLPNIEHATVTLNERNRVVVRMDAGWVFWRRDSYIDEEGNMYEPTPENISYSRYGVFSPATDFSLFVIVPESEVPADQIYGSPATPPAETV